MKKTVKKETQDRVLKDRVYILRKNLSPLTYTIKSRDIYYFDEEKGFERELKYTENQITPFVDEFKGDAILGHITFIDGVLKVPKEKQTHIAPCSAARPFANRVVVSHSPVHFGQIEKPDLLPALQRQDASSRQTHPACSAAWLHLRTLTSTQHCT